jgi:hypothetical protein
MASIILAGTTTGTALSLTSDTSGELQIQTNNGATTALTLTTGGAAVFTAGTVSDPAITTTGDTNTGIFFPAADTIAFTEGGAESMRIDSSGNVGIGTSSPAQKLDVQAADYVAIRAFSTNSSIDTRLQSFSTGAYGYAGTISNHPFAFITNNTERMRITSGGDIGIGTSVPSAKFHVAGSATNANIGVAYVQSSVTGDLANAAVGISKFDNNSTTSQIFVKFGIANYGAGSGQINANGANAAAFGSFSDSRLKENIEDLQPQLANITALRPVEFDYIESEGGGHQVGFIAQEMQEIYPDAVGERSDGMLTVTGWSKTEARLVKAIQEQQALIENLTTRLNALEGN